MSEPLGKGLTPAAWAALLARLTHDLAIAGKATDAESVGDAYELLRRKLCDYFRRRSHLFVQRVDPEALADETLDRLARNLLKGAEVPVLGAYAHGIARLVLLEQRRKPLQDQSDAALDATIPALAKVLRAELQEALQLCLRNLAPAEASLVIRYYHTFDSAERRNKVREALAQEYDMTPVALRSRVHRSKAKLLACLQKHFGRTPSDNF